MTKKRKYTYSVCVWPVDEVLSSYWFQNGKLTIDSEVDFTKGCSSHKQFYTRKKFISFLNHLLELKLDVIVTAVVSRKNKRYIEEYWIRDCF